MRMPGLLEGPSQAAWSGAPDAGWGGARRAMTLIEMAIVVILVSFGLFLLMGWSDALREDASVTWRSGLADLESTLLRYHRETGFTRPREDRVRRSKRRWTCSITIGPGRSWRRSRRPCGAGLAAARSPIRGGPATILWPGLGFAVRRGQQRATGLRLRRSRPRLRRQDAAELGDNLEAMTQDQRVSSLSCRPRGPVRQGAARWPRRRSIRYRWRTSES
jgi:hypothetical protein